MMHDWTQFVSMARGHHLLLLLSRGRARIGYFFGHILDRRTIVLTYSMHSLVVLGLLNMIEALIGHVFEKFWRLISHPTSRASS